MGEFGSEFLVSLETLGQTHLGIAWPVVYNLLKIALIVVPILGAVAYLTLWERKLIGWMHVRLGPNRVGPLGLLQPIADSLKLLTKEIILPTQASKGLYLLAPVMTIMPALQTLFLPTLMQDFFFYLPLRRLKFTASFLRAGLRTPSTPFLRPCAPRLKWCLTSLPLALPWWWC